MPSIQSLREDTSSLITLMGRGFVGGFLFHPSLPQTVCASFAKPAKSSFLCESLKIMSHKLNQAPKKSSCWQAGKWTLNQHDTLSRAGSLRNLILCSHFHRQNKLLCITPEAMPQKPTKRHKRPTGISSDSVGSTWC